MALTPQEQAVLEHLLKRAESAENKKKPTRQPPTPEQLNSAKLMKGMREARKLTLRDAGELAQVSHSTIAKLEKMPTPWDGITLATVRGLANAYGVSSGLIHELAVGELSPDSEFEYARKFDPDAASSVPKHHASYVVEPDWMRLPVTPLFQEAVGSDDRHMFISTWALGNEHRAQDVSAFQIDDDYGLTLEAASNVAVKKNAYLITSKVIAGSPHHLMLAVHQGHKRGVVYRASEGESLAQVLQVLPSGTPFTAELPKSTEPGTDEGDWHVVGPIISVKQ